MHCQYPGYTFLLATIAVPLVSGCSGERGACSVVENGDGTATVSCPDGSEATISDGRDGFDGADGGGSHGTEEGIVYGSVLIRNSVDLAHLEGVEVVTGDLYISAPTLTAIELPALREVGGHLNIDGNPDLLDLDGLSGLEVVGGRLGITTNYELASVSGLLGLEYVGSSISVRGNAALCQSQVDELTSHLTSVGWQESSEISGTDDSC